MSQGSENGWVLAISTLASCMAAGCATTGAPSNQVRFMPDPAATKFDTTDSRETPAANDPKANLAAVAAFLERTAEYETHETSAGTRPIQHDSSRRPFETAAHPSNTDRTRPGILNHPGPVSANAQMAVLDPPVRRRKSAAPIVRSVSISQPSVVEPVVTVPTPIPAANQPLEMTPTVTADIEGQLFAYLEKQLEESRGFEAEWRLRMAQLALGRNNDALQGSSFLSTESSNLFGALLRTISSVRGAIRNPVLPADEAVAKTHDLQTFLAGRADPVISDIELCQRVVTFGVYDPLESSEFIAGRTTQAIVYVEVRNFQSQKTTHDQYRTALATRMEILTTEGRSVWMHEEPEIEDLCRRRRMDFFVAQRIALPPTLAAGDYVLKVLVEDRLSGRADEGSHRFKLHSATSLAGTP